MTQIGTSEEPELTTEEMDLHLYYVHLFFFADETTRLSLYQSLQAAAEERNLRSCSRPRFKLMIDDLARDIVGPGHGLYADLKTGVRRPIGAQARAVLFDWITTQMSPDSDGDEEVA